MISVTEAKQKILSLLQPLEPVSFPLSGALFRVLAQEVIAPCALPPFDNSAMDGFAILSADTSAATPENPVQLQMMGTQKAGDSGEVSLKSGEAIRIMTGAPIPRGADAIVIKERIEVQKDLVLVKQWVPPGNNIRWCGEEIKQGQKILSGGTLLTSRHIGFLSSLGIARVNVHRPPLVGIVSTGSELTTAMDSSKKVLEPGKIFDSNTPMLVACLKELALEPNFTRQVSDDAEKIFASLEVALKLSDVLLVSGGVSVGDFDYTKGLFHDLGIREVFWGVAQKPGKPFYFGTRGEKWIFGLPGNPASVWTCFYEYVRPALLRLLGRTELHPPTFQVPLTQTQKRDPHKTLFLKGRWEKNTKTSQVQSLQGQGSHMLGSLADANCLLVIPPGEEILPVGELVEVHPLSYGGPSYD